MILLPGSVLPAESAYRDLVTALGPEVDAVAKDLELYATPERRVYDLKRSRSRACCARPMTAAGSGSIWSNCSGGGAASLALYAARPERLASLALLEPAWAKLGPEPTGADAGGRVQPARRHARRRVHAGLHAASTGAWRSASRAAAGRPAALDGEPASGHPRVSDSFAADDIDRDALRRFDRPVYFALGVARATPTTSRRRRGGWTTCSRTSSLRCSRSATTSTRPTASSPSAWPPRSGGSGGALATAAPTTDPAPRLGRAHPCGGAPRSGR